ncbi:MAG: putative baseplate assembly protein [Gemmataceae bacterium]|nr:putative baseplate assembly protein [Gemmataceae bacterium]
MSDALDPSLDGLDDCGCCAGPAAEVPADETNPEGLDRISYRAGAYAQFRATMVAALSASDRPKLRPLTTRSPDDFTLALLDAWATTADVLTFYQERLANEAYLRTATEPGSVLRLARLIGYLPKPGVAAAVDLAFTLEDAPGAPAAVTIPAGVKVQSVPGQDEKPQTFETGEPLAARVEWNAMRPQTAAPRLPQAGDTGLVLRGTATQLQPGDALLIVGNERENNSSSLLWIVRLVSTVAPDPAADRTAVTFNKPLDPGHVPQAGVRVYALRLRAPVFGHNAPDPTLMAKADGTPIRTQWDNYGPDPFWVDLDAAYPKVVAGGWFVLVGPAGVTMLYRATVVSLPSRTNFGLSGKVTRIKPEPELAATFAQFDRQLTVVYAQSELLEMADTPLTVPPSVVPAGVPAVGPGVLLPVHGTTVILDRRVAELPKGRTLIVTGKRVRARVTSGGLSALVNDAGTRSAALEPDDTLLVLGRPTLAGGSVTWRLQHDDGFDGTLVAPAGALVLAPSRKDDPTVSERVTVESCTENPTELVFAGAGLANLLDRPTATIAGNVAPATHGETVEEVAGGGDAGRPFQVFALRQPPLTYVRAETPTGRASTLEVRISDLLWREVRSLYGTGPAYRVYATRPADNNQTTVHFGDGRTGARLPSGQQNVRFKYRKGGGPDGAVRAGQLTTLLTRPLGVREVTNPLPAEGADAPEQLADARRNAPLTVTTLDRAVSLRDYEDFARAYPGVTKALATWTWDGRTKGVFLTVAGPDGVTISPGGVVATALSGSLRAAGDPFVPLRVETYRPANFTVAGTVLVHPDYEAAKVLPAVRAALRERFGFAAREFGQPVTLGEVAAAIHSVAGVVAADIDHLQRTDRTEPTDPAPRLLADLPGGGPDATAAELLVLAPGDLADVRAAP